MCLLVELRCWRGWDGSHIPAFLTCQPSFFFTFDFKSLYIMFSTFFFYFNFCEAWIDINKIIFSMLSKFRVWEYLLWPREMSILRHLPHNMQTYFNYCLIKKKTLFCHSFDSCTSKYKISAERASENSVNPFSFCFVVRVLCSLFTLYFNPLYK